MLPRTDANGIFIEEIKDKQFEDENLNEIKEKIVNGKAQKGTLDALV